MTNNDINKLYTLEKQSRRSGSPGPNRSQLKEIESLLSDLTPEQVDSIIRMIKSSSKNLGYSYGPALSTRSTIKQINKFLEGLSSRQIEDILKYVINVATQ